MFSLPPLPYPEDALAPHVSAETLRFHHGKHHRGYVDTLNKLVADSPYAALSLDELVVQTAEGKDAPQRRIFNNAGQHWNHSFFWNSMAPDGGGDPAGRIATLVDRAFGSVQGFAAQFREQGTAHFGSGWVWLIAQDDDLAIVTTHDADLPLVRGQRALLCCDLWEHAYYLDYRNERARFLDAFVASLANWEFAERNLEVALAG